MKGNGTSGPQISRARTVAQVREQPAQPRTDGERVSMYIDRLSAAQAEISLCQDKLKSLFRSSGRHGDLLVVFAALERAKSNVRYLIDSEEA